MDSGDFVSISYFGTRGAKQTSEHSVFEWATARRTALWSVESKALAMDSYINGRGEWRRLRKSPDEQCEDLCALLWHCGLDARSVIRVTMAMLFERVDDNSTEDRTRTPQQTRLVEVVEGSEAGGDCALSVNACLLYALCP